MTGFGRAEAKAGIKKLAVEMKSLNHRYLEISLRLPTLLSPLEIEIKKKIGELFSRGRIEVSIRMEEGENAESDDLLALNMPRVRSYFSLLTKLKQELALPDEVTLSMLAGFRDIFMPKEAEGAPEVLWGELSPVLHEAMRTLMEMRQIEGEVLKKDLLGRVSEIRNQIADISSRAPAVVLEYRRRLTDRIQELTSSMILDEVRLSQEVAIMAEKSDITEELVRLDSHLGQFIDLLNVGESIGRKVDFLIQEMNREVNTIGSKSGDADIAKHVIEIKSELARLREQVHNIE